MLIFTAGRVDLKIHTLHICICGRWGFCAESVLTAHSKNSARAVTNSSQSLVVIGLAEGVSDYESTVTASRSEHMLGKPPPPPPQSPTLRCQDPVKSESEWVKISLKDNCKVYLFYDYCRLGALFYPFRLGSNIYVNWMHFYQHPIHITWMWPALTCLGQKRVLDVFGSGSGANSGKHSHLDRWTETHRTLDWKPQPYMREPGLIPSALIQWSSLCGPARNHIVFLLKVAYFTLHAHCGPILSYETFL